MKTVYLIDDHEMILPGIQITVESLRGFSVIGTATDGLTGVREVLEREPDILVVDLSVPLLNGFGIIKRLQEARVKTRVILLTSYSEDDVIEEAMRLQVSSYILKENNSSELLNALQSVAQGNRYFSPRIMTRLMEGFPVREASVGGSDQNAGEGGTRLSSLTPREREVMTLVANGLKGREICESLHISESTMKTHKAHIMEKLGVDTTNELIILVKKDQQLAHLVS